MVCLSHFGKSPAKSLTLEMGLPSPPPSFYLDRACSSHTTAETKIQTITISQDLLPEPAKEGEEAWRDIRILVQFSDRGGSRGPEFRYLALRS